MESDFTVVASDIIGMFLYMGSPDLIIISLVAVGAMYIRRIILHKGGGD